MTVYGFYEGEYPVYSDDLTHELQSPADAEELNGLVATIKELRAELEALRAEMSKVADLWCRPADTTDDVRGCADDLRRLADPKASQPGAGAGAGECLACHGSGIFYEHHGPGLDEPMSCDQCEGTGKASQPRTCKCATHRGRYAIEEGICSQCGGYVADPKASQHD